MNVVHMTIRRRILFVFILIALAGGVAQFLIAGRQLELATLEFYQHHLETDALLVAATFAEPLGHYLEGEDGESVGNTLSRLQQDVGHNYLIVDRNLRVIGYTANTGYEQVDRVAETPELAAARSARIGADVRPDRLGQDTLYLAVTVVYEDDFLGYLVLSESMQPAYNEVTQRYLGLASVTVPVLALVIAASLWISGTIAQPLSHLHASALRMAKGELDTRIDVTSQDEVGQLAEAFNYMAGQIETLMKTQRSFVSNAAHELRTPLMTLKLRAEALADESLSPEDNARYLKEIRQEVDHMAGLVSSLLMLARIDEGRHRPDGVVSDPVSMLHDIMRHWRIEAEAKGVRFEAEIDAALPDLPMSPNDLRLVLDNLLGNAVKYTPAGNIQVRVSHAADGFTLTVRDTGIGFPSGQDAHLFERFYRSEQVRGQFSGNGLGLAVVKAILDHYGASITGHSDGPGAGAMFTVRLRPIPVA